MVYVMTSLQKIFAKEVLIRLTDDGFTSTVSYCGVYRRSTAWNTRGSDASDEIEHARRARQGHVQSHEIGIDKLEGGD